MFVTVRVAVHNTKALRCFHIACALLNQSTHSLMPHTEDFDQLGRILEGSMYVDTIYFSMMGIRNEELNASISQSQSKI